MAPLVTLQREIPRELLAAHLAWEYSRIGLRTQSFENGRPFTLVWVIGPYVPLLILDGKEPDRSATTVHGTQERPVVALIVGIAILLPVVALVEERA